MTRQRHLSTLSSNLEVTLRFWNYHWWHGSSMHRVCHLRSLLVFSDSPTASMIGNGSMRNSKDTQAMNCLCLILKPRVISCYGLLWYQSSTGFYKGFLEGRWTFYWYLKAKCLMVIRYKLDTDFILGNLRVWANVVVVLLIFVMSFMEYVFFHGGPMKQFLGNSCPVSLPLYILCVGQESWIGRRSSVVTWRRIRTPPTAPQTWDF